MADAWEFHNAWEQGSDALRAEIVAFWTEHGALPAGEDPAERARQVLLVARDAQGIAGVCSAFNAVVPRLEHRMFQYRTFVAPRARRSQLARQLLVKSQGYLEQYNERLPEIERALGVIVEVETAALTQGTTQLARWPASQMIFIGRTPTGAHIRIWYFEEAALQWPGATNERWRAGPFDDSGLEFINAWEQPSEQLRAEIIALWQAHKAMPPGVDPQQRAAQVLLAVRDAAGLVGVCSAYNTPSPVLEQRMFNVRAFVAPRGRRGHLATELVLRAKPLLAAFNARLPAEQKALGVLLDVESPALQTGAIDIRHARWRPTLMNFIGRTQRGTHLRIWYFEDAVLSFPPAAKAV